MNQKKKYKLISTLLIISQIVLTAFLSYWIVNQYKAKKVELNADIIEVYRQANVKMSDSLMAKRFINPIMEDSMSVSFLIKDHLHELAKPPKRGDTLKAEYQINEFQINNKKTDSTRVDLVIVQNYNSDSLHFKKEDIIKKGLRILVAKTDSIYNIDKSGLSFYKEISDTGLLRYEFTELTQDKNWNLKFEWIPATQKDSFAHNEYDFYYFKNNSHDNYNLAVKSTFLYLVKEILPQIIFIFFLLGLTATSFYLTLGNLKKQLILNELRNNFIGNISHELKTPVSTVKVALEALKKFDLKKDPKVSEDYLNMASLEADRLDSLIGKVINFSMLDEKTEILKKEVCFLEDIINESITEAESRYQSKEFKINFNANDSSIQIRTDSFYIKSVLLNIFDNAIKYSKSPAQINIELFQDKNKINIEISDNGSGIESKYQKRIFEKFFRVPSGDLHNVKGYGLGLSFCISGNATTRRKIEHRNAKSGGSIFKLEFNMKEEG